MDVTRRQSTATVSPSTNPLEESLKASEERFRAAFNQSVTGMAITDLDGVLVRVNDAFCRVVGHPAESILGQTSHRFTHPDDRQNSADALRRVRAGSPPSANYHKRYIRADGSAVWTDVNLSLVRDADGNPDSLIATVVDVTEQRRTQAALEEREQRLRLIFESITDYAILTVDPNGIVLSWNSGAELMFGYSADEILGRDSAMLWLEEDRATNKPAQERADAAEAGLSLDERWHARKGGERFFASGVMRPMLNEAREIIGFTKICRDVTAKQAAEEQLADERARVAAAIESERARLAEVFQRSPSFMAVLHSPGHVFELVNERYYQLVGHREILGKPVREALPEIAGQGFLEILDRVYQTGEPFVGKEMPVLLQKEPGHALEQCYVDLVYMPTRGPDGQITGIFAHGNDITDRKLAEQALELQARTFDILLAAIEDYVFIFDREHRFAYANRVLLDLWSLRADELPMSMPALGYAPEVQHNLDVSIDEVFRTGHIVRNEVAYTSRTGAAGYFEYILAPVRDASGAVESVAGTSRDISGRKKAAEEREQLLARERAARTEAERASRMKDEFLATLSHELRTPLNAILGWATILRTDATPADVTEGVEVIERNARAQARIIDDLLDMSRIISGKVRLDVQRVELAAVLESAIETVQPAARAKGVQLHAVLDRSTEPVNGDPSRLQQVFWNLLTNAVKFTPRGGSVQVLLTRVNSHLEATVADTGEGIAPEFLPHVFDRFRQADASTRRSHGGLGLGLAIVRQLVELHGGTVTAKSSGVGEGATFTVALPLTVLHPSTAHDEPERSHPRAADLVSPEIIAALDLTGINVLVVDDEPDARALVARLLTGCKATVRTAASAGEAFALLRAHKPHVLISDIGMPGEDGYALIRRVRALPPDEGGTVPALALTAYARSEDRMKAVLAGFQMHVSKPVEGAELLAMVASLAGRAG